MQKRTITVATDATMDLSRIIWNKEYPISLLLNHRRDIPALGIGKLFIEDAELKCELIWAPGVNEEMLLDCWPSAAGQFVQSPTSSYVTAGMIMAIGIGVAPNVDKNILTLREQWKIPQPQKILEA